jgi:hypothetical protein
MNTEPLRENRRADPYQDLLQKLTASAAALQALQDLAVKALAPTV